MKKIIFVVSICLSISGNATELGNTFKNYSKEPFPIESSQIGSVTLDKSAKNYIVIKVSDKDNKCSIYQYAPKLKKKQNLAKIFAVKWQCNMIPNLRNMLGDNFAVFKTTKPEINTLTYKKYVNPNIVVELSGYQGDSHGIAYIPNLIPKNINLQELLKNEKN
ncbi:MAG: DUF2844 domain-containing protein [Burkholderiales bacterium]|nr:DUF2844 domain-containing protein [Burkholderiales bacterium]